VTVIFQLKYIKNVLDLLFSESVTVVTSLTVTWRCLAETASRLPVLYGTHNRRA